MPGATPSERRLISSIGGNSRWAKETDPTAATKPARDKFDQRFELEVDPDGVLPVEERARRAAHARRAYFSRLALRSAQARRAKRGVA
jgi:hypothetical protein